MRRPKSNEEDSILEMIFKRHQMHFCCSVTRISKITAAAQSSSSSAYSSSPTSSSSFSSSCTFFERFSLHRPGWSGFVVFTSASSVLRLQAYTMLDVEYFIYLENAVALRCLDANSAYVFWQEYSSEVFCGRFQYLPY